MKNIFLLLLTFSVFLFMPCLGKNPDMDIVILYTNDVHCAIESDGTSIGYSGLLSYRDEVNKKTPYVTLVDAGDHAQGAAIGSISKGQYIIDIMNEIDYDVVIPGNHEFDYGMEQFLYFTKALNTGYTSCNFRDLRTGELILKPYKIIEYACGVKVAFIGITTPETLTQSVPTYFMDGDGNYIYDFDGDTTGEKLYASVQKAVDDARAEGADYVIAVGHLGENEESTVWNAQSVVAHTKGIDVLIDGHSHTVTESLKQKNLEGKEVIITQTGTQLSHIGKLSITTKGEITTELIGSDQVTGKDANLETFINNIMSKFMAELNVVVNQVPFDLNTHNENNERIIRKQETNLANLIADAYLKEAPKYGNIKVDISLANGGSIRTTIKAGDITVGNIRDVLPFNNELCIIEMPGQSILDGLEMGARLYPGESGGFLHPAGLTYAIDPDVESSVVVDDKNMFVSVAGARRVHSVLVNGEPIDPTKKYKVTGDNYFLIKNGDGYVFNDSVVINRSFGLPSDIALEYIKSLTAEQMNQYKEPQGRVVVSKILEDVNLNSVITTQLDGLEKLNKTITMNVGDKIELSLQILSEDKPLADTDYTDFSFDLKPEFSTKDIVEATFDETKKAVVLEAKAKGTTNVDISYTVKFKTSSGDEYSNEDKLDTYEINVQEKDSTSGAISLKANIRISGFILIATMIFMCMF